MFFHSSSKQQKQQGLAHRQTPQAFGFSGVVFASGSFLNRQGWGGAAGLSEALETISSLTIEIYVVFNLSVNKSLLNLAPVSIRGQLAYRGMVAGVVLESVFLFPKKNPLSISLLSSNREIQNTQITWPLLPFE